MKLGFLTRTIDDIAKAAWLGFDAVELDVRAIGDAAEQLSADGIERVRALCAEHGVAITAALGIEFDHIRALHEFKERIYHVHAKDTELLPERRYRGGINGDPFRFRIPGYGAINWAAFIAALDEIGYGGGVAIEHEDPVYSGERFDEGLARGWQVLYPLTHPQGERTAVGGRAA